MPEPSEGDRIAGRYEIQDLLGRGGFGVAWRAQDTKRQREVALKHPNYQGQASDSLVDKYFDRETTVLKESRAAGGHSNIMSYFDTEDHAGMPYLVVELIEGNEIGEVVRNDGAITDATNVKQIGVGICEAIGFLHDNDIIYRDLKPDNIMMENSGEPQLIDFTTAKGFVPEQGAPSFTSGRSGSGSSDDSTIPGEFKPPELNKGAQQRQGPWSDVYSIGKILCFIMVSWVPDDDGVSPNDFGVGCPSYLDEIVETATQHDRTNRYPNASIFMDALENQDPTMPEQASITWLGQNQRWTISPGDTIGRNHPDGPRPSVILQDQQRKALSAVHCKFDKDDQGNWKIIDTSLNGIYISKYDERDWHLLLSEQGQRRQRQRGETISGDPSTGAVLDKGDTIALVDPKYPERFYFQFSQSTY